MGKGENMRRIVTSVIIGTLLSGSALAGPRWSCTQPQWLGNPGINPSGNLEATLTSSCRIALDTTGNIAQLNQNLNQTLTTVNQVHSGPIPGTFQGMPGVRYDMTNRSNSSGDQTVMRRDVYVASDQASKLVYGFRSTKIDATGNAAFLRNLNYRQEVTQNAESGRSFQLRVVQTAEIAKPWYAPARVFISRATKSLMENFAKEMQVDAAAAARHLSE
jgi:hypothetical protein